MHIIDPRLPVILAVHRHQTADNVNIRTVEEISHRTDSSETLVSTELFARYNYTLCLHWESKQADTAICAALSSLELQFV